MTTKGASGASKDDDFDLESLVNQEAPEDEGEKIDITGYTAAKLDDLIHMLTAKRLVELLQTTEACTPGLLQAAMRFLADNKVTGLDIPESAGQAVRDAYKDKAPFKLAQ